MDNKLVLDIANEDITKDDIQQLATDIFNKNYSQVKELVEMPLYKKIFNCIKIQGTNKKLTIEGISDLSQLMTIFLNLYIEDTNDAQASNERIIETLKNANINLYNYCVSKIKEQEELSNLNTFDSEVLLQLLVYTKPFVTEKYDEIHKEHIGAVTQNNGVMLPDSELNLENIERLSSPNLVYRLFVEHCMLTKIDVANLPNELETCSNYFSLSNNAKGIILDSVSREISNLPKEYFLYGKYYTIDDICHSCFMESESDDNIVVEQSDADLEALKQEISASLEGIFSKVEITSKTINSWNDKIRKIDRDFIFPATCAICYMARNKDQFYIFTTSALYCFDFDKKALVDEFIIKYNYVDYKNMTLDLADNSVDIGGFVIKGNYDDVRRISQFLKKFANENIIDDDVMFIRNYDNDFIVLYMQYIIKLLSIVGVDKADVIANIAYICGKHGIETHIRECIRDNEKDIQDLYYELLSQTTNDTNRKIFCLQQIIDFFYIYSNSSTPTSLDEFFSNVVLKNECYKYHNYAKSISLFYQIMESKDDMNMVDYYKYANQVKELVRELNEIHPKAAAIMCWELAIIAINNNLAKDEKVNVKSMLSTRMLEQYLELKQSTNYCFTIPKMLEYIEPENVLADYDDLGELFAEMIPHKEDKKPFDDVNKAIKKVGSKIKNIAIKKDKKDKE